MIETMLNIVSSFFSALGQQAILQASTHAAEISNNLFKTAVRREQSGVGSHNDSLQAETAWLKAELEKKKSMTDAAKAQAALRYHMGEQMPEQKALLLFDDNADEDISVEELNRWYDLTLTAHPLLRRNQATIQAARARYEATRREIFPSIDLVRTRSITGFIGNAGALSSGSRRLEDSYGLTLNIPLFDALSWNYRVLSESSKIEAAQADFENLKSRLLGDVTQSYQEAINLRDSLQSSKRLVESAEATYESAQKRYARGVAEIIEVLNAQRNMADARRERILTLTQWRAARLTLRMQTGLLEKNARAQSQGTVK
jgi:outer membrane protein